MLPDKFSITSFLHLFVNLKSRNNNCEDVLICPFYILGIITNLLASRQHNLGFVSSTSHTSMNKPISHWVQYMIKPITCTIPMHPSSSFFMNVKLPLSKCWMFDGISTFSFKGRHRFLRIDSTFSEMLLVFNNTKRANPPRQYKDASSAVNPASSASSSSFSSSKSRLSPSFITTMLCWQKLNTGLPMDVMIAHSVAIEGTVSTSFTAKDHFWEIAF